MSTLKKIQDKSTQDEFDKKVLSAIQHLQPYVKHRLYVAESTGILPKNMYRSNDLIDTAILELYEGGYNIDDESLAVKLKLFSLVDKDLDELFKKEAFHQKTVSTQTILEEELDGLEESFSVDADLDFVMKEDFDDISYAQDNKHKHLFLYADNNKSLLETFEIQDISAKKSQQVIGGFYSWLPTQIAGIVDLYVFGKLSFEDISKIKHIEITRIERVFRAIKKSFRKNIN
ncbi:hypothetical protein SAMN04515667_2326 [Formosa sp. Hel1_31_208]|uniref:hypothetical protein n=1 Tax=Formosa sp. Hel1_31_208 TaxID=1798225 RepID=UPI00087A4B32|nr:hypothetical protein [Formosa sp. Hel1_31_208]SDS50508.1 hypothetical protein SAMN04515667_2326 [Formosa sp. Hel1_31_208]